MAQMRSAAARHTGTIIVLVFVTAFVIFAGPGGGGGIFGPSDCTKPVWDTPCGRELADNDPDNPCVCESNNSTIRSDLPLTFEANAGQADASVRFVARPYPGVAVSLSRRGAVLDLRDGKQIEIELQGSRPAELEALSPLATRVNYLLGNDPRRWFTDIPTFERVRARGVYPGIDVFYYGNGGQLEHDFEVAPGADPSRIRYVFRGVDQQSIGPDGELRLRTGQHEITWKTPVLYQEQGERRRHVAGRFREFGDGTVGFETGAYDRSRPLVIDPVLVYATYLGKLRAEMGMRVAQDPSGNVYLAGLSIDPQFPTTAGVIRTEPGASDRPNVTISKLSADGKTLLYSTYIGGQDSDMPGGMAIDRNGNLFVAGYTSSLNFPTTEGALRRNPGNPNPSLENAGDCFVLKLNSSGNRLLYSTYLGGNNPDVCTALAIDASGNAYLTGLLASNIAASETAFQRGLRVGSSPYDGFVAKLNDSGSRLLYFSFFGGSGLDAPTGIAIDANGNAVVAGFTDSLQLFPTTTGAYQTRLSTDLLLRRHDRRDAFVMKFNADASDLIYSTLLGGQKDDLALTLALDKDGGAIVAGSTSSEDFPVTAGVYQRQFSGSGGQLFLPGGDGFVAKLSPDGKTLAFSTLLGGSKDDRVMALALDSKNNIWVTGSTLSTDFPLSTDAVKRTFGGIETLGFHAGDAFVAQMDGGGRSLVYSSYLGGSGEDAGIGLAIDKDGLALIAGSTTSVNLGTTQDAVQRIYGGTNMLPPLGDSFLARVGDPPVVLPSPSIASVANAVSFVSGETAPGVWLVITGTQLGPETAVNVADGAAPRTSLGNVRVLFDGTPAPLLSVSASRVVAIAPFALAGKESTKVVVEHQGASSPVVEIPVAPAQPGIVTADGTGRGPAALLDVEGKALSAASAEAIVTLTGTGGGVTEPASHDGEIATDSWPPLALPVSIFIGETEVTEIFFAGGLTGRAAGFMQIQFRIPAGVAAGDQPLVVSIGGKSSQSGVTITIVEP